MTRDAIAPWFPSLARDGARDVAATVAGVLALNLVVARYVYVAWRRGLVEDEEREREAKTR